MVVVPLVHIFRLLRTPKQIRKYLDISLQGPRSEAQLQNNAFSRIWMRSYWIDIQWKGGNRCGSWRLDSCRALFSCAALLLSLLTCWLRLPPLTTPLIIQLQSAETAERRSCPDDQLKVSTHPSMRTLKCGLLGLATNDNSPSGHLVCWAGFSLGIRSRPAMKPF